MLISLLSQPLPGVNISPPQQRLPWKADYSIRAEPGTNEVITRQIQKRDCRLPVRCSPAPLPRTIGFYCPRIIKAITSRCLTVTFQAPQLHRSIPPLTRRFPSYAPPDM